MIQKEEHPRGQAWPLLLGVLLLSLLGLGIRLIDIDRSLWLDELHTSWTVADGIGNVWDRAAAGNQLPFYFWLNWGFSELLGHTEFGLRFFSVLCGILLIPGVAWAVLHFTGNRLAAFFASLLVAIDPFFIQYSQEARPYALLQLVSLFQICNFSRLFVNLQNVDGGSRDENAPITRIALIATSSICCFIHLTAGLLILSQCFLVVGYLVLMERKIRWRDGRLLLDLVIAGLINLIWLPQLLQVANRKGNWELFVNDRFCDPTIQFQLLSYLLVPLVLISWGWLSSRKMALFRALPLLASFLGPILLAWTLYKMDVAAMYFSRYWLAGWSSAILFCCFVVAEFDRAGGYADRPFKGILRWSTLGGVASLVLGLSVFQNHWLMHWRVQQRFEAPFASTWKETVARVNQLSDEQKLKQQMVYLLPNLIEDQALDREGPSRSDELQAYCQFPLRGIYQVEHAEIMAKPTLRRPRFLQRDMDSMLQKSNIWLIVRGNDALLSDVFNEFAEFGIQQDLKIEAKIRFALPVRGNAAGNIHAALFRVTNGEGGGSQSAPSGN